MFAYPNAKKLSHQPENVEKLNDNREVPYTLSMPTNEYYKIN
jgi:hypothetical protein